MPLTPPQAYRKTEFTHRAGDRADQPLATDVLIGTLYYVVDEGILERSDGTDWFPYTGAGARVSNLVNYTYSATTTSPPASKQVRFNAGHPYTTVTKLFYDIITLESQNIRVGLLRIPPGSLIYVQDKNDSTKFATFSTTTFPTDHTTWVEFDVVWFANGSAIGGGSQVINQSTWGSVPSLTFTAGSVIFGSSTGVPTQDNTNFFWDDTNNRLGIGVNTPVTDIVLSHASIGSQPITDSSTTAAIGLRLANPTAALVGAQSQASPALEFFTNVWDVDSAVTRTPRIAIWASVTPGNTPEAFLSFRYDEGQGSGWATTDDIRIGRVTIGGAADIRLADSNIIFKNSSRGLLFTANPLTDTAPTSQLIQGSTTGKIQLIPLVGGSEGFVEIEHNVFAVSAGLIPALAIRGFDQSTNSPIMHIRHRAVPGGTAANGFGSRSLFQASSSTTSNQDAGAFDCVWSDATHATRTAKFNFYLVNSAAALALKFEMLASGEFYTSASTFMIGSRTSYTNGAGGSIGTLGNAPAAGDPTKWIPVDDNGTTRYVPAW